MILLAHGYFVNQYYRFPDTLNFVRYYKPIEEYAETYKYILVAPNMYIVGGSYGDTSNKPVMDQPARRELSDDKKKRHVLSPNLANKPVFFGYGTEDFSGFDFARKNAAILDSHFNNFSVHWADGGHHSNAWARSLKQIFDFLNEQKK